MSAKWPRRYIQFLDQLRLGLVVVIHSGECSPSVGRKWKAGRIGPTEAADRQRYESSGLQAYAPLRTSAPRGAGRDMAPLRRFYR